MKVAEKSAFPVVLPTVLCRLPSVTLKPVSDRVAVSVVLRSKRMTQSGVLLWCTVSLIAFLREAAIQLQSSGIGCGVLMIKL